MGKVDRTLSMQFTYEELALLNQMISIALMSGKVAFDEISRSVHKKVTCKLAKDSSAETDQQ